MQHSPTPKNSVLASVKDRIQVLFGADELSSVGQSALATKRFEPGMNEIDKECYRGNL